MKKLTVSAEQIAQFIIENKATREQAAKHFGIAVNSVHRYVGKLTGELSEQLKAVAKENRKHKPATVCESGMPTITITEKSEVPATGHRIGGNSHPLMCVETGEIYSSGTDAAEKVGVTQGAISQQITGRVQTCKGLHFIKVSDAQKNVGMLSKAIKTANAKAEAAKTEADARIAAIEESATKQIREMTAKVEEVFAPLNEIKTVKAKLVEHRTKAEKLYEEYQAELRAIEETEKKLAELYESL
jgi:predicted transcriptional regulator